MGTTLRQGLALIFKYKKSISIISLSIASLITAVTLLDAPVYEAKSSILIKPVKEEIARPGIIAAQNNSTPLQSQEELINTEIQILAGEELAEKVINAIHIEQIYPTLAEKRSSQEDARLVMFKAVETFQKNLKVAGVRRSSVITITFHHDKPEIAARAVNLLVESFRDKHLALHSDPPSNFVRTQLAYFEGKLKTSEKELQEYQQENNAFSLDEQRSLLLRQRTDFDSAYKLTSDNISETRKRIASLKSSMTYASNSVRYTPTDREKIITDAKARVLELQLKEQELRRKYTPTNRLVVDAKRELDLVNNFLKEQEEGIASKVKTGNPVYQSLEMDLFRAEADLSSQMAKAEALKGQMRQLDKKITELDLSERKIQELKREIVINEKNYKTYLDRHEDAQISLAMNRLKLSNVSVIQAAFVPNEPIKPKKLNIALGFVFGLFAGITTAYITESVRQTLPDPGSIEKYLGLRVLLTVSNKEH